MVKRHIGRQPSDFHFIGIGGIGMSALAQILLGQGLQVSGSDLSDNSCTRRLRDMGARIDRGHDAKHLVGTPRVVYSTAIKSDNPELAAARDRGLTIWHRSDVLAHLANSQPCIGVAGTHGKTTTSSAMAYTLLDAGLDPTAIIGGEVDAWQGNARCGGGSHLVAEVDESDGSLVKLHPEIGVITNIELDHPDHFQSLEQVIDVFVQYARQSQLVVASLDCPIIAAHIPVDVGYSLDGHPEARIRAQNIRYLGDGTLADIWEGDRCLGALHLRLLGAHNLSNALAVVAVGRHLGLEFTAIAAGLATFGGARRRFERRGQVNGVTFVDDYAHHPTEIAATLKAAKLQQRRVVAIFQPHRYSRTASLFEEFAISLTPADVAILVPIYSAGESPTLGHEARTAEALAQRVRDMSVTGTHRVEAVRPSVYYEPELQHVSTRLAALLQEGDLVLFLGAGNLNQSIPAAIAAYRDLVEPLEVLAS